MAQTDLAPHDFTAPTSLEPNPSPAPSPRRAEDLYAEIAQLSGGLAHEIRNPLSTMRLNLDLLAEDFLHAETDRERRALLKIDRIRKENQRLEGMLDDFLRYVRVGKLPVSSVDLNSVVDEVRDFCEPQSLSEGIVTRASYTPDLPRLDLHVDSFKQALLNLIRNAQQAMPDGGELILRTRREPDWAVVEVIDTGRGIDPDALPKIFDPFFSTRPRGTGLGLPTTRRIIESHGGTLDVRSAPGKGCQFTIRLPLPAGGPG